MALVVLNDADDHRSGFAASHRLPSALDMEDVSARLEDLVRYAVEASPQVRPKALAGTWTDHVDVPEAARATLGRMLRDGTETSTALYIK